MSAITSIAQPIVAPQATRPKAGARSRSVLAASARPAAGNSASISIPGSGRFNASKLATSFTAPKARAIANKASAKVVMAAADEPLRVIIAGAPASGKGTQCETIVEKYGLTHISVGDLLRAEVANGTENGKRAKEFMDNGALVPDEVVIGMVKSRLAEPDAQKGWLLDGYPRSASQAKALEDAGIKPEIFLLLDVPNDVIVERVCGRRSDPETGIIYHMTFNPPPNDEIAARLVQRSDDNEEACRKRLATHDSNVDAVVGSYQDTLYKIDGNRERSLVFADVDKALTALRA